MSAPVIVRFQLDLRLSDNPALAAAAARKSPVLPVFIWAPEEEGAWPPGAASRWWLHQSLKALGAELRRRQSRLIIRRGPSTETLLALAREIGAAEVYWNRRYEPALIGQEKKIREGLIANGLRVETFNSALLFEPGEIKNVNGRPFRIFTPFWRTCLYGPPLPPAAGNPDFVSAKFPPSLRLDDLNLEPAIDWAQGLRSSWQPGEAGARAMMRAFIRGALAGYPERRDHPAIAGTSRLSPHLHFGELSPRRIWAACASSGNEAAGVFLRQLGWREFAHHLLFHFPHTAEAPLRPQFGKFPWRRAPKDLQAWHRGRTGYPIVDAGMRELWATGWMHNRVRMIAASFLVKDLLLSWTEGARWFWDTLVDADLANNTLGWQWAAGCGADAAPYFRIFNPMLQAAKYDSEGEYIRRWVRESGTSSYPERIVLHDQARARALKALATIRMQ